MAIVQHGSSRDAHCQISLVRGFFRRKSNSFTTLPVGPPKENIGIPTSTDAFCKLTSQGKQTSLLAKNCFLNKNHQLFFLKFDFLGPFLWGFHPTKKNVSKDGEELPQSESHYADSESPNNWGKRFPRVFAKFRQHRSFPASSMALDHGWEGCRWRNLGKFGKSFVWVFFSTVYLWFIDCGSKMVGKTGKCFDGIKSGWYLSFGKDLRMLVLKIVFFLSFSVLFSWCESSTQKKKLLKIRKVGHSQCLISWFAVFWCHPKRPGKMNLLFCIGGIWGVILCKILGLVCSSSTSFSVFKSSGPTVQKDYFLSCLLFKPTRMEPIGMPDVATHVVPSL